MTMKTMKPKKIEVRDPVEVKVCSSCGTDKEPLKDGMCAKCWEREELIAKQSEEYKKISLVNNYKGMLREKLYRLIPQIEGEPYDLDGNQDFKRLIPKWMFRNTLEKVELNILKTKHQLLDAGYSEEDIVEFEKQVKKEEEVK